MNRSLMNIGIVVVLGGCGGPQDPRTEDLTAVQHEAEAEQEDSEAARLEAEYDPDARAPLGGLAPNDALGLGQEIHNPTARNLDQAEEHEGHAEAHRARAAELRAFEDRACGELPPAAREACPFLLGVERMEDVPGGVRLTFAADADIEPVVHQLRCHLAFAASEGREGIDECALYVHGAHMERRANVVLLTTSEADLVEELRRRAGQQAPSGPTASR